MGQPRGAPPYGADPCTRTQWHRRGERGGMSERALQEAGDRWAHGSKLGPPSSSHDMFHAAMRPQRRVRRGDTAVIVAAQLLDGISAATLGVLVPLVIADTTRNSGHFNLAQGVVGIAVDIGASLGTTMAG